MYCKTCLFVLDFKTVSSAFFSTPVRTEEVGLSCSVNDEMKQTQEKEDEMVEAEREKEREHDGEEDGEDKEEEKNMDSLEWVMMRNTDSVFSELSELSREYAESVDQGVSVRGRCACAY